MSNRITIVATKFTNLDEETEPSGTTYGFRAFDNFDMTYCNAMTEEQARQKDLDLLRDIVAHFSDSAIEAMIDSMATNKTGIEINGTYYEWEEVKETILAG